MNKTRQLFCNHLNTLLTSSVLVATGLCFAAGSIANAMNDTFSTRVESIQPRMSIHPEVYLGPKVKTTGKSSGHADKLPSNTAVDTIGYEVESDPNSIAPEHVIQPNPQASSTRSGHPGAIYRAPVKTVSYKPGSRVTSTRQARVIKSTSQRSSTRSGHPSASYRAPVKTATYKAGSGVTSTRQARVIKSTSQRPSTRSGHPGASYRAPVKTVTYKAGSGVISTPPTRVIKSTSQRPSTRSGHPSASYHASVRTVVNRAEPALTSTRQARVIKSTPKKPSTRSVQPRASYRTPVKTSTIVTNDISVSEAPMVSEASAAVAAAEKKSRLPDNGLFVASASDKLRFPDPTPAEIYEEQYREVFSIWSRSFANFSRISSTSRSQKTDASIYGTSLGIKLTTSKHGFLGIGSTYAHTNGSIRSTAVDKDVKIDAYAASIYGGTRIGIFQLNTAIEYALGTISTTRISPLGLGEIVKGRYKTRTYAASSSLALPITFETGTVMAPEIASSWTRTYSDAYIESGSVFNTSFNKRYDTSIIGSASLSVSQDFIDGAKKTSAYVKLGYEHEFGDLSARQRSGYISGSTSDLSGSGFDATRGSGTISLGGSWSDGDGLEISGGYKGKYGSNRSDTGAHIGLKLYW